MTTVERELSVFHARCINDHEFESHNFSDFEYGERLIRTTDGQVFGLLMIDDTVVDEVGVIVDSAITDHHSESDPVSAFNQVFGFSCDPIEGHSLDAARRVTCPVCFTSEVDYDIAKPGRTKTFQVPVITHEQWLTMTPRQRRSMIEGALRADGVI